MKIFLGLPVLSGNGCKHTLTNLSHVLKKTYPTKKVALVDFDLKSPYLAHRLASFDKTHSLDNLIDKIDGNFLTKELFSENMIQMKNGVDLLKGTKLLNAERLIKQKHIEVILKLLEENYDYVFISAGNENNIALISSIVSSTDLLLILKNDCSNLLKLPSVLDIISNYKTDDTKIHFIINFFNDKSDVSFTQAISDKKIVVENIEVVSYMEDTFDNLNLDKSNPVSKLFKSKNVSQETYNSILNKII